MDYTLAKQLKDNGFPQTGKGYIERWDIDPQPLYVPTLEELIEECKLKMRSLELLPDSLEWRANGWDGQGEQGKTPKIAVARLWLALNSR